MHLHGRAGIQYSVLSLQEARSLLMRVARVCSTRGRLITLITYSLSGILPSLLGVRSKMCLAPLPIILPTLPIKPPPPLPLLSLGTERERFSSLAAAGAGARSADAPRRSFSFPFILASEPGQSEFSGAVLGPASSESLDCALLSPFFMPLAKDGRGFELESRRIDAFLPNFGITLLLRFCFEFVLSSLCFGVGCGLAGKAGFSPVNQTVSDVFNNDCAKTAAGWSAGWWRRCWRVGDVVVEGVVKVTDMVS